MAYKFIVFHIVIFFIFSTPQKTKNFDIARDTPNQNTIVKKWNIQSLSELKKTLSKVSYGDTIFISGDKIFDLSHSKSLIIPDGITLMSDRGENNSIGALFITSNLSTNPMIYCRGNNINIIGLRVQGPDGKIKQEAALKQRIHEAQKA